MVKRRKTSRSKPRKSYARRTYGRIRRHASKGFPLSVGVGLATSLLSPPITGYGSAMAKLQAGVPDQALQSFLASWTGIQLGGIGGQPQTSLNIWRTLNPFDLAWANGWKTMFWTHIITKVVRKFAGDPFRKIPYVGKYVRFS